MTPTIRLSNLQKSFGRSKALDDITLSIGKGERVALVGHNGSGKSTLVRCLLGLHNYQGAVEVFGMDARSHRETILGKVSFVPQNPPALRLGVLDYLTFAQRMGGVDPATVTQHCEAFGFDLAPHLRKPFHKLSGGMKQKLLVAVALARAPELLIMDEPTANLDVASRTAFYAGLEALTKRSTMLLVSHRIDELAGLVTRTVELDHGQVIQDDAIVASSQSGDSELTRSYLCQLVFTEIPETIATTLTEWRFSPASAPLVWEGQISAGDRFRFLAQLARWSGVLRDIKMTEHDPRHDLQSLSPGPSTGREVCSRT